MRLIKHILIALAATLALTGCNQRSAAIDRMVEELNSPVFRAEEAKTGLFDDSKAEINGKQLTITFLCRPFINLASVLQNDLSELKTATVNEFKANLANDKFREGIEALRDENMSILLVWQDVNGATIRIPLSPAEILPNNG